MREMKDSGIEWIGEIPKEWQSRKLFGLLSSVGSGTTPKGDEYYSGNGFPWLNTGDLNDGYISETSKYVTEDALRDCSALQIHKAGSVVIAMYGATIGKLGITEIDVTTNQACCVMNPSKDLEQKYLFYLLSAAKDYFIYSSYGAGQPNISQNTIKQLKIPYTCIQEQKRIADYLDSQCAKIDSIIEKQQAIIEKLIEYKLSVITEAVSIGIDGKKELRETGIPWIEAMPTEWKIARIKYNFYLKGRIGWQGLKANEFIDEGPFLVTGTDFIKGRVNWNTCYHISQERYDEAPEIHVKLGDLLITKDGTVGKVAYIDEKPEQVSLNSHLLIMRPTNNEYSNRFLFWVIQSGIFKKFFGLTQNGTIMASLSQEKITDFIYIMPRFEEQERISKYLEKEIARVDSNIEKKLLVIDKLNDYKKSLIYEVVTGKKEV